MNVRWIKHLDTIALRSAVYRNSKDFGTADRIGFRGAWNGEAISDDPLLVNEKWKSARNAIARVRRTVIENVMAQRIGSALGETGCVYIERLDADSVLEWRKELPSKTVRTVLTLETNPGALLFVAGSPPIHMETGSLVWFNAQVWHSMLNTGGYPVIHLVCEFELGII